MRSLGSELRLDSCTVTCSALRSDTTSCGHLILQHSLTMVYHMEVPGNLPVYSKNYMHGLNLSDHKPDNNHLMLHREILNMLFNRTVCLSILCRAFAQHGGWYCNLQTTRVLVHPFTMASDRLLNPMELYAGSFGCPMSVSSRLRAELQHAAGGPTRSRECTLRRHDLDFGPS